MKILGLRRRREKLGRRNSIESWFSKLKRRIKQFNACFPTREMDKSMGDAKLTVSKGRMKDVHQGR